MIRCAIIGASGYTGLELIKLLLLHRHFEIAYLFGSSEDRIERLYPALRGVFEKEILPTDIELAASCDLVFLALPHKSAMEVAKPLLERGVKVVDLSADYRLKLENYEAFYTTHTDKEHLSSAVYGLPELFRQDMEKAQLIANPGCYPTATLLALAPFAPFIEQGTPIMVDAKSGVSGAGKKCKETTHFVQIDENHFAYTPIIHRHSIEIKEKLEILAKEPMEVIFVPHLLPVDRGMLVDCYIQLQSALDPLELLKDFYANEPFVRILKEPARIKNVAGTHFCDIFAQAKGKVVYLSSAIDNLLRGASSQAVANANLLMGLPEEMGLPKIAYVP